MEKNDTDKATDIEQTSATSTASPDKSPYYNRTFWAGYKGYTRGMLGGLVLFGGLGAIAGALIGVPLDLMGVFKSAGLNTLSVIGGSAALFGGMGVLKGMDVFGNIGATAGIVSAGLEIEEERDRAKALLKDGHSKQEALEILAKRGHDPYEKELSPPQFIHWNVAAVGVLIGAIAGALLGAAAMPVFFGIEATAAYAPVAMAAVGATAGASFGIDRYYYRKLFNFTNRLYDAKPIENDEKVMEKELLYPEKGHGNAHEVEAEKGNDGPHIQERHQVIKSADGSIVAQVYEASYHNRVSEPSIEPSRSVH